MLQAKDLHKLIKRLVTISEDILVYTGYSINELLPEQLDGIAVLIDGEYIEALNNNCILRGSSNQKINILSQNIRRRYESYCDSETNSIQNFMTSDGIISVGIHKPGFINDLNSIITGKGIEKSNE